MWWRTAKRYVGGRRLARDAALLGAVAAALAPGAARASLPDGRAWELVSPSAKLGNDVIAASSRTRAAAAEAPGLPMAASFASLGGFADVRGTGVSTEYLAQRTAQPGTSGWTTHAITPAQQPLSLTAVAAQLDPVYEGDMAHDLTQGVFRAWSPVTAAPNVQEVENLYLRRDLRTAGAGDWGLLTGAVAQLAPIASGTERPYLVAASPDFRHVLFESRLALTADAVAGNVMLYKADDGVVRLIALGPGCPAGVLAAPCSIAGAGAAAVRRTQRTLSEDGSRVHFVSPVTAAGTISNRATAPSALHQLDDRGTPATGDDVLLQVNASEKATPDAPRAARFQTASTDGERVYFTSAEQLTETAGSGLYLWRRAASAGQRLTLIGGGASAAAIGASRDGRRVYFTADAPQLVPGGPLVRQSGVYVWEDDGSAAGELSFVAPISFGDATQNVNATPWNLFQLLSRVTPDGGRLLFGVSDGGELGPAYDHGRCPGGNPNGTSNGRCTEYYLYSAERSAPLAPHVVCATCPPSGAPATENALVAVHVGAGASQLTSHVARVLSDDGRRVFFSSAEALVPQDANGRVDAYEYDVASGTHHLLSSGRDAADSYVLDASASGDDVFLATRERLVGWDVDESYDLYDARVGGGMPEPVAAPAPCAGDACRGVPRAPPPLVALGSPAFAGEANAGGKRVARPARRRARACRRGLVRKRVKGRRRCVRRAAARRRGPRR